MMLDLDFAEETDPRKRHEAWLIEASILGWKWDLRLISMPSARRGFVPLTNCRRIRFDFMGLGGTIDHCTSGAKNEENPYLFSRRDVTVS